VEQSVWLLPVATTDLAGSTVASGSHLQSSISLAGVAVGSGLNDAPRIAATCGRRHSSFNPEPTARPATVGVTRLIASARDDWLCRAQRREREPSPIIV